MPRYRGFVHRISYSETLHFDVEAESAEDAAYKISEEEGNPCYREVHAEYVLEELRCLDEEKEGECGTEADVL